MINSVPISLLLLFAICLPVAAQTATPPAQRAAIVSTGSIRGRVVNATTHAPISGASVAVFPVAGGSAAPIAATTTVANGSFQLRGLPPGRYVARMRIIGFRPIEVRSIVIAQNGADVDLHTLAMAPATVELAPIVVTAPAQAVQLAPDRNTYVVQDMPTTRGGSALEVLRNVPGVGVDIDNTISLRGNTGVVVQINGRPSPLKASQLGNFLAQLPADVVAKVEVVTNPSARESPEGVAGIINIVLKQKPDAGTAGAVTVGGSTRGHRGESG